ncbi:MAG: YjfI family protein [Gammaproteobacteria bacterium]|nr:YjfI family protein [Gammaproteobacteria bacterium]
MSNEKLDKLIKSLTGNQLSDGSNLSIEMFDGEDSVAIIIVEDRDEFPIYMTVDDGQILCISYLFGDDQVDPDKRASMAEAMLIMNVSIPLSAFSKIGNQYIMFGALSPDPRNPVLMNLQTKSRYSVTMCLKPLKRYPII